MTVDRDTRRWSYNINVAVCHKSGRLANLIGAEGEKKTHLSQESDSKLQSEVLR